MALHKGLTKIGFNVLLCEKHFHDHDETWVILQGKGPGTGSITAENARSST